MHRAQATSNGTATHASVSLSAEKRGFVTLIRYGTVRHVAAIVSLLSYAVPIWCGTAILVRVIVT